MGKTLVIVLSETRAHELTFDSFKKNLVDPLKADVCVCIGIRKQEYDYNNPFYKMAKHRFLYEEPDDFGIAFDEAYSHITKNRPRFEILPNMTHQSLKNGDKTQVKDYGKFKVGDSFYFDSLKEDEGLVYFTNDFSEPAFKESLYGVRSMNMEGLYSQENTTTLKKGLHWREFLKIKDQFLGGIKDEKEQHPGSAGILIFFRWFLMKKIQELRLTETYDRFIITRSDFLYTLPHPQLHLLDPNNIWIPDGEQYGGYTDRHVVLSSTNIFSYLNLLEEMILKSNHYFLIMKSKNDWNLEQLIKFHLIQQKVDSKVKKIPYIMYSVRKPDGSTRWATGVFYESLGYNIKYPSEYNTSHLIQKEHIESKKPLDQFYRDWISLNG